MHMDAESVQDFQGLVGESFRQGRQDAISRLDQVDRDVFFWIDSIKAIAGKLARGGAQLGRKLGSGGAGADDCQVYLPRLGLFGLRLRPKEGHKQQLMEALGVVRAVQLDRMLANTRSTEVVAMTADRDDQRVVGKAAPPQHFTTLVVQVRRELDLALGPVEPDQFADAIVEMVPMGLRPEFHLLDRKIHASCRDLMQQRLPEVGPRFVNQRNIGDPAPAQRVAKPRDQLEASGTAADDDDAMRSALAAFVPHPGLLRLHALSPYQRNRSPASSGRTSVPSASPHSCVLSLGSFLTSCDICRQARSST